MTKTGPDSPVFSCQLLNAESAAVIKKISERLDSEISQVLEEYPIEDIISSISGIQEPTVYHYLPKSVFATFEKIAEQYDKTALGRYKKRLAIGLIGEIDAKLATMDLPKSILDLYPDTLDFIIKDLLSVPDDVYLEEPGAVIRELRLTSTRSLPCGAQIVDNCTNLPASIYRNKGKLNNLKCLWFVYGRLGGLAPLFRIHTDTRYLKDFNEAGWDECYLRIADLMRRNPKIRGMVGTSWFYDPQLETVSPRLAYLRRRPQENGAYLQYNGPGEIHTQRATATSKTRRRLYETGEYVPTCYTLIWARRDLLRWAQATENAGQ